MCVFLGDVLSSLYIDMVHRNFAETELTGDELCEHEWIEDPKHIFTCKKCRLVDGLRCQ